MGSCATSSDSIGRFGLVVALSLATLVAAAHRASAEPTPTQKEAARLLFNEGIDLRDARRPAEGLDLLRRAWSLAPTPIVGLELARTHVLLAQLVEARDVLVAVEGTAPKPKESAATKAARVEAKQLLEQVRPRIPTVSVTLGAAPANATIVVRLDQGLFPPDALERPYELDPGSHTLSLELAGKIVDRQTFSVSEGERKAITLTAPDHPAARSVPSSAPEVGTDPASRAPASVAPIPSRPPVARSRGIGWMTWTGLGITAAGLAVGGVSGVMAASLQSDLSNQCPNRDCPPPLHDDLDRLHTTATLSTIGFAVAGGGVLLGALGWMLHHRSPERHAVVQPWVGLGTLGVAGAY